MAVFKCKMCGGTLEINNKTVAVCEYCGTKQTLPKIQDDVIINLHNRANNLRLKCEFDKAESVYEKILDLDNADSEAHWGVVLCKYGIEYVEDPKTYTRIPTCHRTLYEAVLTDADYVAAIENADTAQKEIYVSEARTIDALQKNILSIVSNEEPFDVFVCYKETDSNGKRTVDSAIANDIYYQLTQENLKVFYAPITLEDKLGHEYEPYIFAALNSAKVMLVVGTKPEYFEAVWVRNEWSRFLKFTKTDRSKLLIPCFRDMDAYELPDEFAHLQAQDMSKIGFINDIVRGIKKTVDADGEKQTAQEKVVINDTSAGNITAFLKRGYMALEDSEWQKADDFFEQALNQNAELAEAYLGKMMAEIHIRTQDEIKNCAASFENSRNYQKVLRFGDNNIKALLEAALQIIKQREQEEIIRRREENCRNIYNQACSTLETMQGWSGAEKGANVYIEAIDQLRSLKGWGDSEKKISLYKDIFEQKYAEYKRSTTIPTFRKYKEAIRILEEFDQDFYELDYRIRSMETALSILEKLTEIPGAAEKIEEYKPVMEKLYRRKRKVCQHCGGEFIGMLVKKCAKCGKTKDYNSLL